MTKRLCSIKWIIEDTVDPKDSDTTYSFKGKLHYIKLCTFWMNTATQDLFMCMGNFGTVAVWKRFSLT